MNLNDNIVKRIKADAEAYALPMVWVNQNPKGEEQLFYEYISSTSYIAGATAEHAQNESVRLQLEAQDANVGILLSQKKELIEKAQKLADALEWIKTYGSVDDLTVKFIDKALNEWEGAGKEDDKCRCIQPNWNAFTGKCLTCGKS